MLALGALPGRASAHAFAVDTAESEPLAVASGTVLAVRIDSQVSGTSFVHRELRLDSGGSIALRGNAAEGLQNGTRVRLAGRRTGSSLEAMSAEVLSAPAAPSGSVQVEGKLAIAHADDFANNRSHYTYEVHDDTGGVTALNLSSLPSNVHGGSRILVLGKGSADGSSLDPETITVESDATGSSAGPSGLVAKSATTNTVLVILANFNNTTAPSYSATQALQVMQTDSNSVANFYGETSYGSQLMNVTVTSTWVTMNLAATCSYTSISSAANTAAQALSSAYTASNYNFVVYLFPSQACGWAGLAYVGYPHQAFINGTGSFVTQVVAHEMGHNFGLLHAGSLNCGTAAIGGSCSVAEYGDPWDTMGNQRAMHFNAKQKSLLGWIPPASVITHSSGSASYTLSPLETAGGSVYAVKIPTSNTSRTYWLEFRQPIGFDAALASYPTNGAQVRVANPFEWTFGSDDTEILDMTPGSAGGFGDSALVVGQSYLDSTYGVNIIVTGATASALTVTVATGGGTATTTTTLASSVNPSTAGSTVTFTATVTGSSPTGSVNFTDGGSSISGCGAVALSGSGNTRTAACATSALTAGTHSIAARYSGDGSNASSSSSALSQAVNGVSSTTGIATSLTPTFVGTSVTFTATVSGASPTGTVNFKDGSTSISGCSTAAVSGSGNIRTATCTTSALGAGSHGVSALYSGDPTNTGSTSSALMEMVNQTSSSTALASSSNPSMAGASVTFTASVTGYSPTGTISFNDGGTSISGCSAIALTGSGNTRTAQCSTSALTATTHSITASYGGDANNVASTSSAVSQVVNASTAVTITLASSTNPMRLGRTVTYTATVTGANPTGAVAFTASGSTIAGCGSVTLSGSGNSKKATCATSFGISGTYSIGANYGGDANNAAAASAPLSQIVKKR
jgi:hypothetical protein